MKIVNFDCHLVFMKDNNLKIVVLVFAFSNAARSSWMFLVVCYTVLLLCVISIHVYKYADV